HVRSRGLAPKTANRYREILCRLFNSGVYEVGPVQPSLAPSMDIQVASNFERFIYYAENEDAARTREVMQTFKSTERYAFADFDRDAFRATRVDDGEIPGIIRAVHERYGYMIDPHTACAFAEGTTDPAKAERPRLVVATAHPAKFPDTIEQATGIHPTEPTLEALKERAIVNHPIAPEADAIRKFIATHAAGAVKQA
ncbi:MAG: hypothetical protein ACOCVG_02135, partial [Verrucomicrobiota bacterium]